MKKSKFSEDQIVKILEEAFADQRKSTARHRKHSHDAKASWVGHLVEAARIELASKTVAPSTTTSVSPVLISAATYPGVG